MDIAALIFAPFVLARIYGWSRINTLPAPVRIGLPAALMAILFVAFVGYGPAVQEAIATRASLIRAVEGISFLTFHLDGLSLVFSLLITGVIFAAMIYEGTYFADGNVDRNFLACMLDLASMLLAFVLINHIRVLPIVWACIIILIIPWLARVTTEPEPETAPLTRWRNVAMLVASFAAIVFLQTGLEFLEKAGLVAKQLLPSQSLAEISQLSTANLSNSIHYGNFLFWTFLLLLGYTQYSIFRLLKGKTAALAYVLLELIIFVISPSFLFRFYPAAHDNPIWWAVITGIGLLIMLIAILWALEQPALRIIWMSLSGLGSVVALLGLPEYLGIRAALMTVIVYGLVMPALLLKPHIDRRNVQFVLMGLVLLPLMIVDAWTIQAFYKVNLQAGGIMLSAVMISVALMIGNLLRVFFEPAEGQQNVPIEVLASQREARSLQITISAVLAFAALLFVVLFEFLISPLFSPPLEITGSSVDIAAVGLCLLAWGGGVILYLTRDIWSSVIGEPQP
jgi:NADH:ubiquinone oxidoreductase subunit 5 (subunit L)/multisubunit Na+/H+ antiporter MnhA subunit